MIWLVLGLVGLMPSPSTAGYLSERQIESLQENLLSYRRAGQQAGVPALALAAIHYRETDLEPMYIGSVSHRYIRAVGGPFMLDCGGNDSSERFKRNIRRREQVIACRFGLSPPPRVSRDFDFAALCAACELHDKVRGRLYDRMGRVNRDVLADALWGYHGRSKRERDWRHAAYVVNDPHHGKRFVTISGTGRSYMDARAGALVIYDEITRRLDEIRAHGTITP